MKKISTKWERGIDSLYISSSALGFRVYTDFVCLLPHYREFSCFFIVLVFSLTCGRRLETYDKKSFHKSSHFKFKQMCLFVGRV